MIHRALSGHSVLDSLVRESISNETPVLLLVNDPQRSTRTRSVLRILFKLLRRWDVEIRFRALVATGTHRFSESERREFERSTFDGCGLKLETLAWHVAEEEHQLVEMGGVRVHRLLAESRQVLPIGSVEPHYFAGFTGPHKTVTIGCLSFEDIERNHAAALEPGSDILKLDDNPIHGGVVHILDQLTAAGKRICAIGQVVVGENVVACAAGAPLSVLDALRPVAERIYHRWIEQPADIVRLRVPPPLGRSLYQADKAIKNNHRAVRDGGGIVLEAGCEEGIGQDAFCALLRKSHDHASALRLIRSNGYRLGDHKAVRLRHLMDPVCRDVHLVLVAPGLSNRGMAGTGLQVFPSPEDAISSLSRTLTGPICRGLIVDDAAMLTVSARRERP
ncbi:MAG: lactate racemase domain-containing protein [Phycisphaerae bacterium]